MLPDFPKLKKDLLNRLTYQMKQKQSELLNPLSQSGRSIIFEGDKFELIREDGSIDKIKIHKFEESIETDPKDIKDMAPEAIVKKIDIISESLAQKQANVFFKEIEEGVKKVGNVVKVKGGQITPDDFFKMLKKIYVDFDELGQPYLPQIVAGKVAYESLVEMFKLMESDLKYNKQFSDIMETKKLEWNVRESNRKLVG